MDKSTLLTLLRESESYVSGQEISKLLGVSRSAVWKVIKQLREDGYDIEAVSNRGYRLKDTPDNMSKDEILSRLQTVKMGRDLYYFDETDSTNVRIRVLADEGASDGALAVSDMQTSGRGRRGRGWISPAGMNIYMSLLLEPKLSPSDAPMITLIMALAVSRGIMDLVENVEAKIKWPNDIVINGKKVCGILTEMMLEADYIRNVIVGVGINVNQDDRSLFAPEISESATSIRLENGHAVDRSELIARIMYHFEKNYDTFLEAGDLSPFKKEYEKSLVSMDKEVRVLDPKGEYTGISRGIDDKGELIVETAEGERMNVYAGEVSVRGLYGYV
ncbi:MAG: biotin--[acetyl-CoA-carboxylase] ligase [Lachnospiraceae bacterium]|nr:biotin--[acetyl-CoA-carboxylase] ligase [Lachnospiraceae bacterium]